MNHWNVLIKTAKLDNYFYLYEATLHHWVGLDSYCIVGLLPWDNANFAHCFRTWSSPYKKRYLTNCCYSYFPWSCSPSTGIYLFKANNGNIRQMSEICVKLTIKTLARRQRYRSAVFIVKFEQIQTLFWCFHF